MPSTAPPPAVDSTLPEIPPDERNGPGPQPRDRRIDLFRGLALWFIFLDHIPDNAFSWLTMRNFGFSDASEAFVFIAGYSAALAYGSAYARGGWPLMAARVWRRAWQLYAAHILLFVALSAQIVWVSQRAGHAVFLEEMNLLGFLEDPARALIEMLLLRFRLVNLDVLPLYIVLLAIFPLAYPFLRRAPMAGLAAAVLLYLLARRFDWNLAAYPEGRNWYFDPLAWQLLFVAGAVLATDRRSGTFLARRRWLTPPALAMLIFGGVVALSWQFQWLAPVVPDWLGRWLYPIDKTMLDPLRLAHFLALAYLAVVLIPADARILRAGALAPVLRCGEHPLPVFCLGILLSFTAHVVIGAWDGALLAQALASLAGIAILVASAYITRWYKAASVS